MIAILSDVHANLEAFRAVLGDAERFRIERIVCLGDLMLYGPDPLACVDLAREVCDVVLLGDTDANLMPLDGRLSGSAFTEVFTREYQRLQQEMGPLLEEYWDYLRRLPRSLKEDDVLYVHGSPRNPIYEYVFPEDCYNEPKMAGIFERIERVCFAGHTHVPGIFGTDLFTVDAKTGMQLPAPPTDSGLPWSYLHPAECALRHAIRPRMLVNVGSVGQPRDGDPRASYVLFDGTEVHFRRVEYDVETTLRKIDRRDPGGIDGRRLAEGR